MPQGSLDKWQSPGKSPHSARDCAWRESARMPRVRRLALARGYGPCCSRLVEFLRFDALTLLSSLREAAVDALLPLAIAIEEGPDTVLRLAGARIPLGPDGCS